ncbi:MAG: ribose 5-phosphate isomerase B [Bdellovibrionaceae bacterium]|jgi:ribose 5-phosphate isomerase B|nr:ribose 5-phosphate isomerase B [Pseudobdellovibrionaceae bacterium]
MNVYIASDHGGFNLKSYLIKNNPSMKFQDLGPTNTDSVDYPDYAKQVCEKLKQDPQSLGILICGSGQGMAMSANKYAHIRAALCWNQELAELSKLHNDANILCMGERVIEKDLALNILSTFLETKFEGGRHERRVQKMKEIAQ